MSRFLSQKTFGIHHALNPQAKLGQQVLLRQKMAAAFIYPLGDILQIPSLIAGNVEIWLCKHIKQILTKKEWCADTGHPGPRTLGQELSTPRSVMQRQRLRLECQNHLQQACSSRASHLGPIHLGQACGLLIAFPLFNPLPPPPQQLPPRPCP